DAHAASPGGPSTQVASDLRLRGRATRPRHELRESRGGRIAVCIQRLPALVVVVVPVQNQSGTSVGEGRPEVLDSSGRSFGSDVEKRMVPVGDDACAGVGGKIILQPGQLAAPVDALKLRR